MFVLTVYTIISSVFKSKAAVYSISLIEIMMQWKVCIPLGSKVCKTVWECCGVFIPDTLAVDVCFWTARQSELWPFQTLTSHSLQSDTEMSFKTDFLLRFKHIRCQFQLKMGTLWKKCFFPLDTYNDIMVCLSLIDFLRREGQLLPLLQEERNRKWLYSPVDLLCICVRLCAQDTCDSNCWKET